MKPIDEEGIGVWVGLDWADEEHAYALRMSGSSEIETGDVKVNPSLLRPPQILLDTGFSVVYIRGHGSRPGSSGASRRESGVLTPGVASRGSDPGG